VNGCRCEATDYGFEMPDCRARYFVPADSCSEPDMCGDGCCCGFFVRVVIRRAWSPCPDCYHGSIHSCSYDVKVGSRVECNFDCEYKAECYIEAAYPTATRERDYETETF
jgi:hypothetical protein